MHEKPVIYALLPNLSSEVGHIFHYHLSSQQAVQLKGWRYEVVIPKETQLKEKPSDWRNILVRDGWDDRKGVFFRLRSLFGNLFPLWNFFRKIGKEKNGIVFLEHFELQNLASLFLALLFLRPKFHFWILHRYAYGKGHLKAKISAFFHRFLEWKLGKRRVMYLTDSELLAQLQGETFKREIFVLPIPHTKEIQKREKGKERLMWWPGGSLREDKGLSTIRRMVPSLHKIELVVAETGKTLLPPSPQLLFVPTLLSEKDYTEWMERVDCVILPYDPIDYAHRTSGIFVEAVAAGVIPFVSRGSWMGYELEKFGLERLTFSWEEPWEEQELEERFLTLLEDREIEARFRAMSDAYRSFHSKEGFGEAVGKLWERRASSP